MRFLLVSALAVVAAAGAASAETPADARCQALVAEKVCTFAAPAVIGKSGVVGQLSKVEGRVLAASEKGYTPIRVEKPLVAGDRVLVLDGASATLTAGEMEQKLPAPAMVSVVSADGCGCISVDAGVRTFAQSQSTNLTFLQRIAQAFSSPSEVTSGAVTSGINYSTNWIFPGIVIPGSVLGIGAVAVADANDNNAIVRNPGPYPVSP